MRAVIAFMLAAGVLVCSGETRAKTLTEMFGELSIQDEKLKQLLVSIDYQQGDVALGQTGIRLKTGNQFYYLSPSDTKKVVVDLWQNPPTSAEGNLGMLFPAKYVPAEGKAWGSVIVFEEEGHVSDADAGSLDADALLRDMKAGTEERNAERKRLGYPTLALIGWASPPFYDQAKHHLHWARDLLSEGQTTHTLNYSVRVLGREGTLAMNFVAELDQLDEIKAAIPTVMQLATFEPGKTYTDYRDGDKLAAYGIGGLIAAGAGVKLAAKTGLLLVGLAFLKKGWILIVLFGAAIVRWLASLFKRGRTS